MMECWIQTSVYIGFYFWPRGESAVRAERDLIQVG